MEKYKFKQSDLVSFKTSDDFHGIGEIVGVGTEMERYMAGMIYLVRVVSCDSKLTVPNENYPFNTIAISELFLTCHQ